MWAKNVGKTKLFTCRLNLIDGNAFSKVDALVWGWNFWEAVANLWQDIDYCIDLLTITARNFATARRTNFAFYTIFAECFLLVDGFRTFWAIFEEKVEIIRSRRGEWLAGIAYRLFIGHQIVTNFFDLIWIDRFRGTDLFYLGRLTSAENQPWLMVTAGIVPQMVDSFGYAVLGILGTAG